MIDVFISHAPADAPWARTLADRLKAHGLRIFFDEWNLLPGDVIMHGLEAALLESSSGIAVVSPAALASPRAMDEYAALYTASAERGLRFIPVLIGDVAVPPLAATRIWGNFHDLGGHEYEAKVQELADAILGRPGPGTTTWWSQSPPSPLTEPDRGAVVVCYVTADEEYGRRLTDQLRRAGLPVWSIADLRPGDAHFWTIRQQLRYAVAVVVLMSRQSQDSDDITRMILEGQAHGRPFVPILLHERPNYHLAHAWYLDARDGQLPGPDVLAGLAKLVETDGNTVDLATILPAPTGRPTVRATRQPTATSLRQLDTYLGDHEFRHGDLLTTRMLLTAAERTGHGWLRRADARLLSFELLAGIDEVWARHTHGRQGFRAQLGLTALRSGRDAEFLPLSVDLGWRDSPDAAVPRYHDGFADRPGPGGRTGFFPTLRAPQNEHHLDWYKQWTATVLAVHLRLREWERNQ
ncbi:MAG TPA: toll/interleukin-1 receptor domain-containing protein [Pseudonocardiaceae bacterium]|nr:toll/interleukin-1 receptor domain-containing protein [Pseudonocardiaceae bacterium]